MRGKTNNPRGAPRRGESWADIIAAVGRKTGKEAAMKIEGMANAPRPLSTTDLKTTVVLCVFAKTIEQPDGRLLRELIDRAEGRRP